MLHLCYKYCSHIQLTIPLQTKAIYQKYVRCNCFHVLACTSILQSEGDLQRQTRHQHAYGWMNPLKYFVALLLMIYTHILKILAYIMGARFCTSYNQLCIESHCSVDRSLPILFHIHYMQDCCEHNRCSSFVNSYCHDTSVMYTYTIYYSISSVVGW